MIVTKKGIKMRSFFLFTRLDMYVIAWIYTTTSTGCLK